MKLTGRIPGWEGHWEITIEQGYISRVRKSQHETGGRWISPGFIDLQVNGFSGFDINSEAVTEETVVEMVRSLWKTGVTRVCPTIITGSRERILRALRSISAARKDPRIALSIPCIHLEGPYISPEDGPRGAHSPEHVRPPSWDEFNEFQNAAEGGIGIVTLAPEIPGAIEFIERLSQSGVIPAIGHTAAKSCDINNAIASGARLSTHLGNGSHALIPRHPNYIWDQLAADRLYASYIVDGFHLPPSVVKTFLRAKGVDRSILITDAISVAGQPPGEYDLGGLPVQLNSNGKVELKGTEYLAGSALTIPQALGNVMAFTGVSLETALRLVTENPATLLGIQGTAGTIRVGAEADLIEFDYEPTTHEIHVRTTVLHGDIVMKDQ